MATVDVSEMGEFTPPDGDWGALAERVLELLDRPDGEVALVFCDDETIHPLNRDWRGYDKPTDVLSFSQVEGPEMGDPNVLGDVIISVPTAQRQADEREQALAEAEW